MSINTLIQDDLDLIYGELYDDKAEFRGVEISVFYSKDYEVQSSKEKVITAKSKDVAGINNSDVITINKIPYKVISFYNDTEGRETTIGLEK